MAQHSAESVRQRWRQRCLGGRVCSTARLTHSGERCSIIISLMLNRMKTSQRPTSPSGETKLQFSQGAFLASHSVMPASEEARRMTATSGRSCCGALSKSDPVGLLARMLLESPRWHSPVRMLRWEHRPINKTLVSLMNFSLPKSKIATLRIIADIRSSARESKMSMKEYIESHRTMCLMKYAHPLKKSDIPSSRCLFRLVPWELRTEGTGCSSLRTEMLPTPRTCSAMGASLETERMINHEAPNLETIIARKLAMGILPTPQASQEKYSTEIQQVVGDGIMPTPTARDWKVMQACEYKYMRGEGNAMVYESVPGRVEKAFSRNNDGEPFRLSPLFTEEMMGFPFLWATLPFLSANGSEKASKPTATPSSHK